MKISKKSLWYKLAKFYADESNVSNNLCIFFWQAVLGLLKGIVLCIALATISIIFVTLIFAPLLFISEVIYDFIRPEEFSRLAILGLVEIVSIVILGCFLLIKKTSSSVIGEYISSKRDNYCIDIEFEDYTKNKDYY
jgi:hypothetical protein